MIDALKKLCGFYRHYFALYIKSNEIPIEDWQYSRRLERKLEKIQSDNRKERVDKTEIL
jgi:hypothetical protein